MQPIFLISVFEDGKTRLFPLPFQNDPKKGTSLDVNRRVTGSVTTINSYPENTVFATDSIVSIGDKYSCSSLFPVTEIARNMSEEPSKETQQAWETYKSSHPDFRNGLTGSVQQDSFSSEDNVLASFGTTLLETLRLQYPCPTLQEDGFYVKPEVWDLLLRNVNRCQPTLIYGCQGLGKTELVLALGKAMDKPVKIYDMGSMHDPMSQMLGTHRLVSDGTNTVSKFEMARFTQDIQEDCIILLDELNRAPVTTMNFLLPLMDSRRMLPVEGAFGEAQNNIAVNPKCCFIATANIGSRHVGTAPIDPALWSRTLPIELEHLEPGIETELLTKRFNIKRGDASIIVNLANKTRQMARSGELTTEISPRETLRAASLAADGFQLLQAMSLTFLPMFEKDERDVVKALLSTR